MLKIDAGEPWVMWPDMLVANFIENPANKILDYDGDFRFILKYELINPVTKKSSLFSKLPSYFGVDLEENGLTLIITDITGNTDYVFANFTWEVSKIYTLLLLKENNILKIIINNVDILQYKIKDNLAKDDISHIIFGAGNFPKNGFNLNYFSFILHYLLIEKEGIKISEHNFDNFIHNKSFDITNNCNFIHKI
jgi:hypothetical protein